MKFFILAVSLFLLKSSSQSLSFYRCAQIKESLPLLDQAKGIIENLNIKGLDWKSLKSTVDCHKNGQNGDRKLIMFALDENTKDKYEAKVIIQDDSNSKVEYIRKNKVIIYGASKDPINDFQETSSFINFREPHSLEGNKTPFKASSTKITRSKRQAKRPNKPIRI